MAPLCGSHSTSRLGSTVVYDGPQSLLLSCTTLDLSEYLDKQRVEPPFRPGSKMYP
jgi:hypothetical protein